MHPIILASQSPRRKLLLEWAEVSFEILVKPTDESFPAELTIEEVPIYIAHNKAVAVFESTEYLKAHSNKTILAADTIVVLGNRVIGKPGNKEEAIDILLSLSGNTHKVITGVVLLNSHNQHSFSDTTEVTFHELTKDQIIYYVEKYQPFDKAGSYAIQEWIGVTGIKSVLGDFYNVMGLPVSRVVKALRNFE